MKKICLLLIPVFALALTACGSSDGQDGTLPSQSPAALESAAVSTPTPSPTVSAEIVPEVDPAETFDKIEVTMELDEMLSQAIVTITNHSTYVFDGSISVYFKDAQGKTEASDMVFVEELTPGNFTYARINLDNVFSISTLEYNISDSATFVPAPSAEGGTLDEETSQQLAADFEGSFGGAGNPEYATSWYPYVVSVEVFDSDGSKNAVITVSDDSTEEGIDRIGHTIFANYTQEYGIASVEVETVSGEQVFLRTR